MQNFTKTILNAVQNLIDRKIRDSVNANASTSTADWNQNDPSAPDYVKNRTHWEEGRLVPIISEMTVTIDSDGGYKLLTELCSPIIPGQTYTVILNGTTYECVARRYNDNGALIGNGTIYGDDYEANGEPFSCDWYDDGTIYLNTAKSGVYTISIYVSETVVHKLDKKFIDIPDNVATTDDLVQSDWIESDNNKYSYIKNKPRIYEDHIILKDVNNGLFYKIYVENGTLMTAVSGTLDDFWYDTNPSSGIHTITGWKQTYYGEPSTIMVVPDDENVIV